MASNGKLNRRVRSAWYRKNFQLWKENMIKKGCGHLIECDMYAPWNKPLVGKTEWNNDFGIRITYNDLDDDERWDPFFKDVFPKDNGGRRPAQIDPDYKLWSVKINSVLGNNRKNITSVKPDPDTMWPKPIVMEAPGIEPHVMRHLHEYSINMAMTAPAVVPAVAHHPIGLIAHEPDIYSYTPEAHAKIHGPKWGDCIISFDEGHPDGDESAVMNWPTFKDSSDEIDSVIEKLDKICNGGIPKDKYLILDSIGTVKNETRMFDPDICNKITEYTRTMSRMNEVDTELHLCKAENTDEVIIETVKSRDSNK